jgi:hypothetical protein
MSEWVSRRVNLTSRKEAEQAKSATPTTLTFLSSLTIGTPLNRCHPAALKYLTDFKKKKERGLSSMVHIITSSVAKPEPEP